MRLGVAQCDTPSGVVAALDSPYTSAAAPAVAGGDQTSLAGGQPTEPAGAAGGREGRRAVVIG